MLKVGRNCSFRFCFLPSHSRSPSPCFLSVPLLFSSLFFCSSSRSSRALFVPLSLPFKFSVSTFSFPLLFPSGSPHFQFSSRLHFHNWHRSCFRFPSLSHSSHFTHYCHLHSCSRSYTPFSFPLLCFSLSCCSCSSFRFNSLSHSLRSCSHPYIPRSRSALSFSFRIFLLCVSVCQPSAPVA